MSLIREGAVSAGLDQALCRDAAPASSAEQEHPHDELPGLSRREFVGPIGTASMLTAWLAFAPEAALAASAETTAPRANQRSKLDAFDLGDVMLLDGPFLRAQKRAQAYLLSLEPDRLLHGFRVNAGLKPKANLYSGWESEPDWKDIHCQGHSLGHYLSGCALMARSTGDKRLLQRITYIVDELAACQAAANSGLICAFPEGPRLVAATIAGEQVPGVPWYTLHKLFAGLRDAHLVTGNLKARQVLIRFADWTVVATRSLSDAQFETMLRTEHGGMNEIFADLYAITGNIEYRKLAERFSHKAVLQPLARSQDHLDGLHANTQIPKIIGFQRVYETAGDSQYHKAAAFFWKTVAHTRSYVTGGHGDGEYFFPVADFAQHVFSPKGSETCGQYNMLKLSRMLFMLDPQAAYADFYERVLYNGILASQDPDSGMVTYFQGSKPGYLKLYCTPVDSFWCCTGTGMESHAKYGDSIYFHDNQSLLVNLFIPSRLRWKDKGLIVTQTTSFPEAASTQLHWKTTGPVPLALKLRHPSWSRTAKVEVNGELVLHSDQPGSFLTVERTWKNGDIVDLTFSMEISAEALPTAPDTVAFTYGPVVLSGALGTEGVPAGADIVVSERKYGSYVDTPFEAPQLAFDPLTVAGEVKSTGRPLEFVILDQNSREVRLIPYYRIAHERYATYWKLERPSPS